MQYTPTHAAYPYTCSIPLYVTPTTTQHPPPHHHSPAHRTGHDLQLVDTKSHTITWYKYSHETRVLLLAKSNTAGGGSSTAAGGSSTAGGGGAGGGSARGGSGGGSIRLQGYQFSSRGILKLPTFEACCVPTPEDVFLINLYGRVYCCILDMPAQRLLMYRVYR